MTSIIRFELCEFGLPSTSEFRIGNGRWRISLDNEITDAVHAKGGKIVLQLWHIGRGGHSSFFPDGEIVAPSAIGVTQGHIRNSKGEAVPYEVPRALETDEIPGIVEDFLKSAELAKQAGFDGIEIHGATGYLVTQLDFDWP
ncbi:hypothetical protein Poli38472_001143 [Pythium oligandrum]|uniref:NADH:flavin oxidoreductase/NADH oxidase N-terminal domain-containing protein n=1 Tax=Pythium oligandrum TaxID=41045 RepID=A0A8K1FRG9_PYTOL|nr:hypothetical protein Poli38472_001143 [Pythium oligandrum]|eukprot:TMW68987.1 hypothetical protein Poli38472_001143 [Pythium oligandrum]